MRQGWAGGLPPTLGSVDFLRVTACGSVLHAQHPSEAVPSRFAATSTARGIRRAEALADLVGGLVESDPANTTYGLSFAADLDPLTIRLRTVTRTAMHHFLRHPLTGPGRWLFTAPDHGRWIVTRPWGMDAAFIGQSTTAARHIHAGRTTGSAAASTTRDLVG